MDVLQPTHLIFILVVALLVLGPKRLPEVGRSLGKGLRDFRGALSGLTDPNEESSSSEPSPVTPVTPATTSFSGEDAPTASTYAGLADHPPVVTPAVGGDAYAASAQSGSALLPHVEPEETYSDAPPAGSHRSD